MHYSYEYGESLELVFSLFLFFKELNNDPSAGSPTETLLRLLLPLDNVVRSNFQSKSARESASTSVLRPH
jgi:hypothetical protein